MEHLVWFSVPYIRWTDHCQTLLGDSDCRQLAFQPLCLNQGRRLKWAPLRVIFNQISGDDQGGILARSWNYDRKILRQATPYQHMVHMFWQSASWFYKWSLLLIYCLHCNCLSSIFSCWQFWQYLQLFQQLSTSSLSTLASFYHWSTGLKLHHLSIVSIFGFTKRRQIAQKKFARFAKKGPLQHEKNWCGWSTTTKLQILHKKIRQGYARSSLPKKKMNSWKRFRLSLYQKEHTCIAYV